MEMISHSEYIAILYCDYVVTAKRLCYCAEIIEVLGPPPTG